MTFSRFVSVAAVAAVSLSACAWTEQGQIAAYFEEAQILAEGMAQVGTDFETLMTEQENPLEWNAEAKAELDVHFNALKALQDEAAAMTVPEAFANVHPLLVQSIGEMVGAVDLIRGMAADPSTATIQKADDMTAKAENGERLANEYVAELELVLAEKYPEMMEAE